MMKSHLELVDIDLSDLDLIFKVTAGLKLPTLSHKVFLCTMSHEVFGRFQADVHVYNIGT